MALNICRKVLRSRVTLVARRGINLGIDRMIGQRATDYFIKSMDENNIIDTPTICVSDPANIRSWEWVAGLDLKPKLTMEELANLSKSSIDALAMVEKDLSSISSGIRDLLGSDHPVLEQCAKYFFEVDGGKKIRPSMVLAVSYALSAQSSPNTMGATPAQKRLAEISEMIHTASLFHDDVIDKATMRRNLPSVNVVFGNKLSVLGGDFLLSRASISLARLRNPQVMELLATVIEHLVKGEVMQMKSTGASTNDALIYYLKKNFYKTASLMGHTCLSAAVLGEYSEENQRAAYLYGTYLGQAFQLIDDVLDFEGTAAILGKAPLADLKSGLATAPTIFATEEYPQLQAMSLRKFEKPGDVDEAVVLVSKSRGLQRTKELAQVHTELAIEAIMTLEPSVARDSLVGLAAKIIARTK